MSHSTVEKRKSDFRGDTLMRSTTLLASLVAALMVVAVGCRDEVMAPGLQQLIPELEGLGPGIHPVLAIPGLGGVRYDPETLEVVDGAFGSLLGAWHLMSRGATVRREGSRTSRSTWSRGGPGEWWGGILMGCAGNPEGCW